MGDFMGFTIVVYRLLLIEDFLVHVIQETNKVHDKFMHKF